MSTVLASAALPNVLGEVELDASIMDGRTRNGGAVAVLRGYGRAITLARRVMDETPHVLIAGHGADRLAAELGEQPVDQRTDEALRRWRERFDERGVVPGDETNLREVAGLLTRPVNLQDKIYKVRAWIRWARSISWCRTSTVTWLRPSAPAV